MLHHPHTDVDHLKTVDGIHYDTFAAAYQFCVEVHAQLHPDDYYGTVLGDADEDEFVDEPDLGQEDVTAAEWNVMAGELPHRSMETEDIELLGNRVIDVNINWMSHAGMFDEYFDQRFVHWKLMKEEHPDRRDEEDVSQSAVDRLNPHQRLLYETTVVGHWEDSLNLNSYGFTGTTLLDIASFLGLKAVVVRASPTLSGSSRLFDVSR